MCKSLIFTEFSNIANQIVVKKSFRKQWSNGLCGIARTLNSASQPVKKRRALFQSVDSPSQGKRFLVQLVLFFNKCRQWLAWLLEVRRRFFVVFLTLNLKSRNFVKICFYIFCHKLNLVSGENSPLKKTLSFQNHLFYSIKKKFNFLHCMVKPVLCRPHIKQTPCIQQ